MNDPAFARAIDALVRYEHFAEKCAAGKGLNEKDSTIVAEWLETNQIALLRARLVELEQDAAQKARIAAARAAVIKSYGNWGLWSCRATVESTRRLDSQIAKRDSAMLVALASPDLAAPSVSSAMTTPAHPAPTRQTTSAAAAMATPRDDVSPLIDSFGFDTRATVGVGGFVGIDVYPVVLFKNGEALTDVEGLAFPGGLDAHRRAHPSDWTRWRRTGGELQLMKKGRWDAMTYRVSYAQLPDGFRLDGVYRSLSGTGNVAIGGAASVAAWRTYSFTRDGRVTRADGAGGYNAAGDVSVATGGTTASRRGAYRVDGLTLRIAYDDGSTESHLLVANPKDPDSAIWLDGVGYSMKKRR